MIMLRAFQDRKGMTSNCYKVVFDGHVAEGRRVEEVRKNLALLHKIDNRKIERIFAGRRIVIEKDEGVQLRR